MISACTDELKRKIGQMMVVGFPGGEEGYEQLERVLKSTAAGNIILFSRNFATAEEAHAVIAEVNRRVQAATGTRPLVCLDQEGGIVARIRQGVTPIPGAMAIGAAYGAGRISLHDVREIGRICGSELAAIGVNWNLAPVVDVNVNPDNPVIGVRSFGEEPELVADLASAYLAGLESAGVAGTAKHFPGHGDTNMDSHLSLPLIPHGMERLEKVELVPFKRLIAENVPVVMTAHVRFPAVEPDELPATLSKRVLTGLLRGKLGYRGLITTDCLEMKAIAGRFEDAAARAVEAGADFVMISHTAEAQEAAFESIVKFIEAGRITEAQIDESVARIAAAKKNLPAFVEDWSAAKPLLGLEASETEVEKVSRASLSMYRGADFPVGCGSLYIDVEADNLTGVEDGTLPVRAAKAVQKGVAGMNTISLPPDPEPELIRETLAKAESLMSTSASPDMGIVLGLYNPKAHPAQLELVRGFAAIAAKCHRRFGLVSMRSPYDAAPLSEMALEAARKAAGQPGCDAPSVLCAYEYSPLSAKMVADFIEGRIRADGRLPSGVYPRSSR